MAEANWSLEENGACIADVSNEATHVASSAANLLSAREDVLWITGDAPQHVTIRLSGTHPPLLYAGWHVWHDYLTNPKTVEVASGESSQSLAPLIICQALPGEGTQVWRLPGAGIPSNHTFVRFRIMETFGPGPTYMNNVVLLAADPGPSYQTNSGPVAGVPYPATSSSRAAHPRTALPPASSISSSRREVPDGVRSYEPLTRGSAAVPSTRDDSVGLFRASRDATSSTRPRSVSSNRAGDNTGRMSQLLRDLDDDIKLLKPIKSVSPTKNMLLYVPQEAPQIPSLGLEDVYDDVEGVPQARSMSYRSAPSQPARQHVVSGSSAGGGSGDAGAPSRLASSAPAPAAPAPPANSVYYIAPPPSAPYADIPKSYQDRLATLEQAVASLTQSVQHQREDLTMIKRLLLQQATERRRDAERRLQRDIAAPPPPPPAPAVEPPRLVTSSAEPSGRDGSGAAHLAGRQAGVSTQPPFTAQHVAVDFPEEALRSFVQSVMADQVKKQAKKTESRVLHRLDEYLQDVVQSIADSVDDRVRARLDGGLGAAAAPSASTDSRSAVPGSRPSRRTGEGRSSGTAPEPQYGDPSHPISIIKDSSFDTSGSGARQHRY